MRRSLMIRTIAVGALTLTPALRSSAQGDAHIAGRITDSAGAPIAMAEVWIEGSNLSTRSDSAGRYAITVPAPQLTGRRAVLIARMIYWRVARDTIVLAPGDVTHHFVLHAMPPFRRPNSRTDSLRLARGEALPACLPEDEDGGLLLEMFRSDIADTRGPNPSNRELSGLPRMDSAAAQLRVTQVESGPLCELALRAYGKAYPDSFPLTRHGPRRVRLIRVDSLYLVNDPAVRVGEWTVVITFNSSWVPLKSVLR